MKIRVNGKDTTLPDGLTITALLTFLKIPALGRAVAVNLTFVPRSTHDVHVLSAGDEVDIVTPMQGG